MTLHAGQRPPLPTRVAQLSLGSSADGFVRLCREIAEGLDLPQITLQLNEQSNGTWPDSEFHWPSAPQSGALSRRGLRSFPVWLADEQVGALVIPAGAIRRLGAAELQMLTDVVHLLGPVLHLARLERERNAALVLAQDHAERIAAARRQAFAERDQERRELERDLHDGAQHKLVALGMVVGLLEFHLSSGDLAAAGDSLAHLRSGIEQAEQNLLSTAAGSCPQVLVDQGLGPALTAEFDGTSQRVQFVSEYTAGYRFSLPVETAVYFTCLEAVNNAYKHAPGAKVMVMLREGPEGIGFAIVDDGPGLDELEPSGSFGLGNMRSRIQAVGGNLELSTVRGVGTRIEGVIPFRPSG